MAKTVQMWLCSDAADVARSAAEAITGDLLLDQATGNLYVATSTGAISPPIKATQIPAATASAIGGVKLAANVVALTDNSGGVAGNTLPAITAGAAYSQTDMQAVQVAIASLALHVNAIRAGMVAAGQMTGP